MARNSTYCMAKIHLCAGAAGSMAMMVAVLASAAISKASYPKMETVLPRQADSVEREPVCSSAQTGSIRSES
jgi:hypothetical protein